MSKVEVMALTILGRIDNLDVTVGLAIALFRNVWESMRSDRALIAHLCWGLSLPGIGPVNEVREATFDIAQLEPVHILRTSRRGSGIIDLSSDKITNAG